jgi:O-antigen ligase
LKLGSIEKALIAIIILSLITGTKLLGGVVNIRIYTLLVFAIFVIRIEVIPAVIGKNSAFWLPLFGFLIACMASIMGAINPLNTVKQLVLVATFLMIPLTMAALVYKRPENIQGTLFWLMIGAFVANINGYLDPFYRFKAMGWGGFFGRPQSFFAEGNEYGQFMVMIWGYLLAMLMLRGASGKVKFWAAMSSIFMFPLFMINNSRGSFLGFALQCMLIGWLLLQAGPRRYFLKIATTGSIAFILVLGLSYFVASRVPVMFDRTVADIVLERLSSFGTSNDETTQIRVGQQKAGFTAFLENPITGTGLGNILYYLNDRSDLEEEGGVIKAPTATTAFWLTDLLGETGILGTSVMGIVILVLVRQAYGNYRFFRTDPTAYIAAGNFLSLCGMLLNGVSYPPIYLSFFWLNVGICMQLSYIREIGGTLLPGPSAGPAVPRLPAMRVDQAHG